MNRASILDEARRLTTTDREQAYGDCVDTHRKIAEMWSLILGEPIGAEEVALCMAAVKIIRACSDIKNADHFIDGAAYLAIAGECAGAGDEKSPPKPAAQTDSHRYAYEMGLVAGKRSVDVSECPYPEHSKYRPTWMHGWSVGGAYDSKSFPEECSG